MILHKVSLSTSMYFHPLDWKSDTGSRTFSRTMSWIWCRGFTWIMSDSATVAPRYSQLHHNVKNTYKSLPHLEEVFTITRTYGTMIHRPCSWDEMPTDSRTFPSSTGLPNSVRTVHLTHGTSHFVVFFLFRRHYQSRSDICSRTLFGMDTALTWRSTACLRHTWYWSVTNLCLIYRIWCWFLYFFFNIYGACFRTGVVKVSENW